MATRLGRSSEKQIHYRIATALRRRDRLPSKHGARIHAFYLFLWLSNLFNTLGVCFGSKANPNGSKRYGLAQFRRDFENIMEMPERSNNERERGFTGPVVFDHNVITGPDNAHGGRHSESSPAWTYLYCRHDWDWLQSLSVPHTRGLPVHALPIVGNLVANSPINAAVNDKSFERVFLLLDQRVVALDPFAQRICSQDEVIKIISVEMIHQTPEDSSVSRNVPAQSCVACVPFNSVLLPRPTQATWRQLRGKMVRENYCLVNSPTNERRLGHQSSARYRCFAAERSAPVETPWRAFPLAADCSSRPRRIRKLHAQQRSRDRAAIRVPK